MNNLEPNMYIRTKEGKIDKIVEINTEDFDEPAVRLASYPIGMYQGMFEYKKASHNIKELIGYMDILVIENKVKDIDNRERYFFNPVRCDGFTTFEDGKHCMIINMDYVIPVENIKVYRVLTHEMFESISYEVSK